MILLHLHKKNKMEGQPTLCIMAKVKGPALVIILEKQAEYVSTGKNPISKSTAIQILLTELSELLKQNK